MKKLSILALSAFAMTTIGLVSCTKDFVETNTNKNGASSAQPESLVTPALIKVLQANQTRALRLTNELMQVHVTNINTDEIHRYIIRPNESEYMWSNWYTQRTNFLDIYKGGALVGNKTWMGIGRILDVWVMSLITDLYGDVPYTEANNGKEGNFQPKFDKQSDIYPDLFKKLEEANELLTAKQAVTDSTLEMLYNGNADRWRKFGNSLYLRLLLRASKKDEVAIAAKMQEIVSTPAKYPIFNDNSESAIFKFTVVAPYVTAFNTYREYDFNGDNSLCSYFINNLKEWEDPRIDKWAVKVSGEYQGLASGYEPTNAPTARLSYYNKNLMNEPMMGNIINYPELQFILAEAALKGYITGDAKSYYEKGVASAITLWGLTVPTNYLTHEGINWTEATNDNEKMEKIHVQKYYTLFFTDFQQYHEYRRTGFPVMPIGPGVQNNKIMPTRFRYPITVQSLNATNYKKAVAEMGGPDDMLTKVWWNK
ncbi:SusD-like starch-binding protein associating with outer membrane [Chitinophaga skermanii]|uniref:SusD-like starch-binding protein associating with outer membrane n=1 Tax=Chitinophaga skermanii TaxID=331697 RepID=A0A327QRT5_9BACT|nr:SusD/RagB family nutrient-binding outer membrane lipoprotein [Chitinophaga skermanii]RAJ06615.1 SusD-like starch-binding protein associating with outer membrane [Chitinophaga skermanii]